MNWFNSIKSRAYLFKGEAASTKSTEFHFQSVHVSPKANKIHVYFKKNSFFSYYHSKVLKQES